MKTIGLIGGGNMGAAIVAGIHTRYKVCVCEKDTARSRSLRRRFKVALSGLEDAAGQSDILILAVKPQDFADLLASIKASVRPDQVIISIAAGITTRCIEKQLGQGCRVIRAMPNLPALIGEGMTAVCKGKQARAADLKTAVQIFRHVGQAVVVDENQMDAVTAVSGSGPAYLFYFVEELQKAARGLGLDKDLADQLVMQTLTGSLHLLTVQKLDAAPLRVQVTSKGGTTQAALKVLTDFQWAAAIHQALKAARKRSKELAQ